MAKSSGGTRSLKIPTANVAYNNQFVTLAQRSRATTYRRITRQLASGAITKEEADTQRNAAKRSYKTQVEQIRRAATTGLASKMKPITEDDLKNLRYVKPRKGRVKM